MKLKILAVALFTIFLTSCTNNEEVFNQINSDPQPKSLKDGTQQGQFRSTRQSGESNEAIRDTRQSRVHNDSIKGNERDRAKEAPKAIDPDKVDRPHY